MAIVCGLASGRNRHPLAVRDFDDIAAYKAWAARYPALAVILPTVITPRPGAHVYCYLDGRETFGKFKDGELRASSKQYVAAPPSNHPSGRNYQWFIPITSPRDIPVLPLHEIGFIPDNWYPEPKPETTHRFLVQGGVPAGVCPVVGCHPSVRDLGRLVSVGGVLPVELRECILKSLPKRGGQRNDRVFRLVRLLRDVLPKDAASPVLDRVLKVWWALARQVVTTKAFETTRRDFYRAWGRDVVPMSRSVPIVAMRSAAAGCPGDTGERIVAAARAVADSTGCFFLSERTAATAAGVGKTAARKWLKRLVEAGRLVVVKAGIPSATVREATTYRIPD